MNAASTKSCSPAARRSRSSDGIEERLATTTGGLGVARRPEKTQTVPLVSAQMRSRKTPAPRPGRGAQSRPPGVPLGASRIVSCPKTETANACTPRRRKTRPDETARAKKLQIIELEDGIQLLRGVIARCPGAVAVLDLCARHVSRRPAAKPRALSRRPSLRHRRARRSSPDGPKAVIEQCHKASSRHLRKAHQSDPAKGSSQRKGKSSGRPWAITALPACWRRSPAGKRTWAVAQNRSGS